MIFNFIKKNFIFFIIFIYSVAVFYFSKNVPLYWDSADYVANQAMMIKTRGIYQIFNSQSDFGYFPVIPILLSMFWSILGVSNLVTHLVGIIFLPILLIGIYYLSQLFITNRRSVYASIIVGLIPLILVESLQVYLDLPLTSFLVWGFYFWIKKNVKTSIIFLSIAMLIKPTTIIVIIGIIIYYILINIKQIRIRPFIYLSIPIVLWLIWLLIFYRISGRNWIIQNREISLISNVSDFIASFRYVSYMMFVEKYMKYISIFFLVSNYLFLKKEYNNIISQIKLQQFTKKIAIIISIQFQILISFFFYIFIGEFLLRYAMYPIVLMIILSLYFYDRTISNKNIKFSVLVLSFLLIYSLHPRDIREIKKFQHYPAIDLSIVDITNVMLKTAQYISLNYPDKQILGGFHEKYIFNNLYLGYINKKLSITQCDQVDYLDNALILINPYDIRVNNCLILLKNNPYKFLKRFSKNGQWIEVYQIIKVDSAQE